MKQFAMIVGFSLLMAILYGIVQDEVAIRICPEYFTVWHSPIVQSNDLTLVALAWGVTATWWVGLGLGVALGLAAVSGPGERVAVGPMMRSIGLLIAFVAGLTLAIGAIAWFSQFRVPLMSEDAQGGGDPVRFGVVFAAYNGSYAAAFLGGITLCARTWKVRHGATVPPAP